MQSNLHSDWLPDVPSKYGIEILRFIPNDSLCRIFNTPTFSTFQIAHMIKNASVEVKNRINGVLIDVRRKAVLEAINSLQADEVSNVELTISDFLTRLRDLDRFGEITLPQIGQILESTSKNLKHHFFKPEPPEKNKPAIGFDLFKLSQSVIIDQLINVACDIRRLDTKSIVHINTFFSSLEDPFSREVLPLLFQADSWDEILHHAQQNLHRLIRQYRTRLNM
ncbi:MAG: hypothetical protein HQK77_18315, partial [Desulfobacterales bacterium]|nr:hypothetical protein [Desulfobacterales bacterium]